MYWDFLKEMDLPLHLKQVIKKEDTHSVYSKHLTLEYMQSIILSGGLQKLLRNFLFCKNHK